ncbi:hypothetical protein K0M31_004501 [Melipona bicolor]|uniref:Uncharacterized protein n=1 Tax=Melipona bicolor TaxID=60889 RepID=A0AA40FXK0_9HYME|nr:hypothetical protein K0M31_004501 [Melipona bicolor]
MYREDCSVDEVLLPIGYCARCFAAFVYELPLRTMDRLRPSNVPERTRTLARSLATAISCAIKRAPSEDLCPRVCNTSVYATGTRVDRWKKGGKGPRGTCSRFESRSTIPGINGGTETRNSNSAACKESGRQRFCRSSMHVVQKLHSLIAVQPNALGANLNDRLLWGQCVEGAAINTAINRRHKSLALLPAGIDIVVAGAIGSSSNLERATTEEQRQTRDATVSLDLGLEREIRTQTG